MNKSAKIVWWIIAIVVIAGIIWWGVARQSASANTIKIGFVGPLTGDESSIGVVTKAAVQVAVDEVNAAGGVNGKPIQMFYEDGQCNAQAAVSATQKLINIDGVGLIVGGECSTEAAAFGPMAMKAKVIMMSPTASAPSLSQLGKYFFRDYPSDSLAGKFEADYAYDKLGARNVAILYAVSDYGTGLQNVFSTEFQSLGGKIVDVEGAPQDATDYRTALSKIKASNPDLIYSPTFSIGATAMLDQAASLGIKTKFLGSDAWEDSSLQKEVSGKGTFLYVVPLQAQIPQDLQAKILAASGGTELTVGVGSAYDAIKIFAMAIAKVGTDPDKLADAIRATQYAGVSGKIAFDQNGDLTTAAYEVKQIQNGSAVVVSQ